MSLKMLGIGLLIGGVISIIFSITSKEDREDFTHRLIFVELSQVIIWLLSQ